MNYKTIIQSTITLLSMAFLVARCGNEGAGTATKLAGSDTATGTTTDSTYTLPFTVAFTEMSYSGNPLPRLQSYVVAVTQKGNWIISGGRRQGLHTFEAAPAKNFIPDSANNFLYLINPQSGNYYSFDVNTLPANLSAPLQSNNQQFYYDGATDQMYIIGGYGWNAQKTDMLTFNTIMRYNVSDMENTLAANPTPQQVASLIQVSNDDRFAVTGGELFKMNGQFYLVFGQRFDGQYRAFGGNFKQEYTEEVRVFTLVPNTLKILRYAATTNTESDRPFHRRDGNIIDDIDPATGQPRITAFGGVFQPGIIGAYTYPVYITGPAAPVLNRNANQKFSQYECPVISVFDSSTATPSVYHTFFGGIGHYYYSQTDSQQYYYRLVTQEGRNDGFPFVADITTFMQRADGTTGEYIQPKPTANNRLIGASVPFIMNRALVARGQAYNNEVIKLPALPANQKVLAGYIYGGIEAQNPLPKQPNTGTFVSNSVFQVWLARTPSQVVSANAGHEAVAKDSALHRE